MIDPFTTCAITGACLLYMLSLSLGKGDAGTKLRRLSGVFMVLGLVPGVFVRVMQSLAHVPPGAEMTGLQLLQMLGWLLLLAPAAYLVLLVRKRLSAKDRESEWKHMRSSGKRPVEHDRHGGRERLLFDEDEES
ncbi:MAG: hypothetical protein JWO56_2839 [Acidobacteria bacterium]|nr:hypothetical protein [Acidobacteriota bacterium]